MPLRTPDVVRALAGHAFGVGRGALDLVLPPTCMSCGVIIGDTGGMCGACWSRLVFIERPFCHRLGSPFPHPPPPREDGPPVSIEALTDPPAFDRARAAVVFGDISRDLVHRLKYGDRLDLAAAMARLMRRAGADLLAEADLILPVPLHAFRLWRRRFNQSALLARHISRGSGVVHRFDVLRRTRATQSQVSLNRAERRANVSGAFEVSHYGGALLRDRRVVLVDDVLTTGATLDACARVLLRAGAKGVDALTFARVVESL